MCQVATSSDYEKKLMKMRIDCIMLLFKENKPITYIIEVVVLYKGTSKMSQLQTRSNGQTHMNTSTHHKSANLDESINKLQNIVITTMKLALKATRGTDIQTGP